jgi:hypothetical protein
MTNRKQRNRLGKVLAKLSDTDASLNTGKVPVVVLKSLNISPFNPRLMTVGLISVK